MTTACSHDTHYPRYDDGISEINGRYEQVSHPTAGYTTLMDGTCSWYNNRCTGWLYSKDGYRRCYMDQVSA